MTRRLLLALFSRDERIPPHHPSSTKPLAFTGWGLFLLAREKRLQSAYRRDSLVLCHTQTQH